MTLPVFGPDTGAAHLQLGSKLSKNQWFTNLRSKLCISKPFPTSKHFILKHLFIVYKHISRMLLNSGSSYHVYSRFIHSPYESYWKNQNLILNPPCPAIIDWSVTNASPPHCDACGASWSSEWIYLAPKYTDKVCPNPSAKLAKQCHHSHPYRLMVYTSHKIRSSWLNLEVIGDGGSSGNLY